MLKKSALLCSYGKSNSILLSQPASATSQSSATHPPSVRRHNRVKISNQPVVRCASVHAGFDTLDWPVLRPPTALPTPYQIFRLGRGEPYSKRRFYELVKLYHPDKHDHEDCVAACGHLSSAVKMERYRLVVAANDILSDPAKRRAYDTCGAGWKENPNTKVRYEKAPREQDIPRSGFGDSGSAFHNATWEDWERWSGRGSRSRQDLKYLKNERFVTLVAFTALLGAVGHYTQIENRQASFVDQVHLRSDAAHGQMIKAQEATQKYTSRDHRIHSFLQEREASGLIPDDHEDPSKLLPSPERRVRDDKVISTGDDSISLDT